MDKLLESLILAAVAVTLFAAWRRRDHRPHPAVEVLGAGLTTIAAVLAAVLYPSQAGLAAGLFGMMALWALTLLVVATAVETAVAAIGRSLDGGRSRREPRPSPVRAPAARRPAPGVRPSAG